MLLKTTLLTATLSLAATSRFGERCSLNKPASCGHDDLICVAISGSQFGNCEYKNRYPSCGGFTPAPSLCDAGLQCQDDPRKPDSCGMACDLPGICVSEKPTYCSMASERPCPRGLYCYAAPKITGCDASNADAGCPGICL